MKKWLLGGVVVIASSLLGGCYVAPGYSYVRDGYGGDAYYGRGTAVYDDGYYAPGYYAPNYYYGGGYAYPGGVSIGISRTWYGGSRDRYRHRDHYRDEHHDDDHRRDQHHDRSWSGGSRDDRRGWSGGSHDSRRDNRRPAGDRRNDARYRDRGNDRH